MRVLLFATLLLCSVGAKVVDLVQEGAKSNDDSWDTVVHNGQCVNASLGLLEPGDTLR